MPTDENVNIAVLIDAENVDPAYAEHIFTYARSLGNVCIREIYGSGISLNEWADPILINSIHTNFTLRPNRFKNSSDICLVIGAMEILSETRKGGRDAVAAIVIASSDSDFSSLAVHLRSAGIDVIGMGEAGRCNPMWPRACTDFIPLEARAPLTRKREEAGPVQDQKPEPAPVEKTEEPPVQPAEKPKQPSEKQGKTASDKNTAADQNPVSDKNPETDKKRKKKESLKVAPTHKDRVEIIRGIIADQIELYNGRIKSGDLFRVIGTNPEYKYDQQRSRRNPMDYLRKQYGAWFDFEPGENGSSWLSLKESGSPQDEGKAVGTAQVSEPVSAGESAAANEPIAGSEPSSADEPAAADNPIAAGEPSAADEPVSAVEPAGLSQPGVGQIEVKQEEPGDKQSGQPHKKQNRAKSKGHVSPFVQQLLGAGIPSGHAGMVGELLGGCKNLRDSYNRLRQAFGDETGKKYQQMIKTAKIQFGKQ